MNRRSLIKCILGLAAAPKILAEMNFNPPMSATRGATQSLISEGFIGIIPTIQNSANIIELVPGDFCLTDLNNIINNYYNVTL